MYSRANEPDAISGLLAALTDPKATAAALAKIKAAQDAVDRANAALATERAKLAADRQQADKDIIEMAKGAKALDDRQRDIEKHEVALARRRLCA